MVSFETLSIIIKSLGKTKGHFHLPRGHKVLNEFSRKLVFSTLNFLLVTNKEYLCMQQDYYHKQWQSNYQT